jgi:hypothetical protein
LFLFHFISFYFDIMHQVLVGLPQGAGGLPLFYFFIKGTVKSLTPRWVVYGKRRHAEPPEEDVPP